MIPREQLAAYLDEGLDSTQSAVVDRELENDDEALRFVLDQRRMERLLASALAPPSRRQRLRQSVLAAIAGASVESLQAGVLAEIHGAQTVIPARTSATVVPTAKAGGLPARLIATVQRMGALFGKRPATEPSRRDWTWAWSTALAALAIVVLVWVFGLGRTSASPELGQLVAVVGTPQVASADGRVVVPASVSLPVHLGDRLETGDADKAEIRFLDGTTLRLGFNTAVTLGNPQNTRRGPQETLVRPDEVHLLRGQVWTQVHKTTNAPSYALRTEAATATARGTEFGVKLQRLTPSQLATNQAGSASQRAGRAAPAPLSNPNARLIATLMVKEGIVDFTNGFGSVQATAMTESTARADSAPTEPRRLETLQVLQLASGASWSLVTSPLDWPEAATKLVGGGGSVDWEFQQLPGVNGQVEVRITRLPSRSPAAQAGLRLGDVLLAVDGQAVNDARQVASAVLFRPGGAVNLRVRREAGEQTLAVPVHAQTSALRDPDLPDALRAPLTSLLRQWLDNPVGPDPQPNTEARRSDQVASLSRANPVRAAAFNQLGVAYELEDALGPAIRAYGRAAYLDPDIPLYRFNLGLALRKIGGFERALEEFEAAVRLEPGSIPARNRVAEVTSLLGRHAEALAMAETLAQVAPADHRVWELQAQLLLKLQRPTEAIPPARRAAELAPDCPIAHAYLAEAYHDAGKPNEALAAWMETLERAPFEPAFVMNLGTVQRELGQSDAAEQSSRRALDLRPDFALAHRNLGEMLADRREFAAAAESFQRARDLDLMDVEARVRLGDMALQRREFAQAEQAYRETIDTFPHAARAWYGLGETYRLRRRPDDAEGAYRRAIELKPNDADPHTALGIVLYDRGEVDEAERLYRRAIELNPRAVAPYHNLGNLYREARGDLDAAERWFRQALERAPRDGDALGGLASVAVQRGDLAQAEQLLRRAVERTPGSSALHNNLGEVLRQRGRPDEAEPRYRKALEIDPSNPAPYANLGILQAERKQFAEAERTFRGLLERSTGNARLPALVNLATVCGSQGKLEEAESFFRQALDLAPNHPRVAASFASFLADHRLKLDEALTLATRAVEARPDNPEFLDALGWVQAQRGETAAAERTLRQALQRAGTEPPMEEIRNHWNKLQELKSRRTKIDP